MQEIEDTAGVRESVREARRGGSSVGLVPTMGYLHAGHFRLAAEARAENDLVVMSIFVNPTQFGQGEDFERYPRDLERDRQLAEDAGIDILFVPRATALYPDGPTGQRVWVEPGALAAHLCGTSRPGHFRGVATVVAKLFNIVQPDQAYFGQKDAQQAVIIARMVRDLAFPIEVRTVPTVRETDGLALSSRNAYLSPDERRQAAELFRALEQARERFSSGVTDPRQLEETARERITAAAPLARIDYVSAVDPATLQPLENPIERDVLLAVAAYFGSTRLIDNVLIHQEDAVRRRNEDASPAEATTASEVR